MFKSKELSPIEYSNIFDSILQISDNFTNSVFLNSNNILLDKHFKYDYLIAIESAFNINSCIAYKEPILNSINSFINKNKEEWIFSKISYDLKNNIENLESKNKDSLGFDEFEFFIPKYVITSKDDSIFFHWHESVLDKDAIDFIESHKNFVNDKLELKNNFNFNKFEHRIDKELYLKRIKQVRSRIKQGDIYEMNFCQEFYVDNAIIEKPHLVYKKLSKLSPAPFSAYYKSANQYIISASPERYIKRIDDKIISQPIKGTAKRKKNKLEDKNIAKELQNSIKERAENIMIVDLVRNDLSRIPNSKNTIVEELCEIYSFEHVHQMISTIICDIEEETNFADILKATFPMGSMTGAPKIKSMEIIESLEESKRSMFSGSIGYIEPNGDFDFNVIIRSLLYNKATKYLSLTTGGAITYLSNAEEEYQESLLKAEAIIGLFR